MRELFVGVFLGLVVAAMAVSGWDDRVVGSVVAMGVTDQLKPVGGVITPVPPTPTTIPTPLPPSLRTPSRRPFAVVGGVVITSTPEVVVGVIESMNKRTVLQVRDSLGVGAVCPDGSPASVDSVYPDAVVFVCGG
jgi:hypothetical protein